jgi:hypothetical protein
LIEFSLAMETRAIPVRDPYIRSKMSWTRVLVWAALFTVVLFTPIDWSGCGFFRHGAVEFLDFVYVFSWFVIFFALRLRWRLLLLIVTAPLVFYSLGLHGVAEENAAPEAATVGALRQFQSSLDAYHSEHQQEGYPESLPAVTLSHYAAKFYVFEYVPGRDTDGKIVSYLLQATPRRRDCYFYLSFTIADDGKVFYTFEPRAATTADKMLE